MYGPIPSDPRGQAAAKFVGGPKSEHIHSPKVAEKAASYGFVWTWYCFHDNPWIQSPSIFPFSNNIRAIRMHCSREAEIQAHKVGSLWRRNLT